MTNTFPVDGEYFDRITLSPDSILVALSQPNGGLLSGTVIYGTPTGKQVGSVDTLVLPLTFSPDGSRLIGADAYVLNIYEARKMVTSSNSYRAWENDIKV